MLIFLVLRSGSEDSGVGGGGLEIKVCPRCSVLIVKMDDGKEGRRKKTFRIEIEYLL